MKFQYIKFAALSALAFCTLSCSNDDDTTEVIGGTYGEVELYFDNGVAGDALILGNTYTNSNNESLTINRFNYIVSNFVLTDSDGNEFTYPKEESYFVVSEENGLKTIHLENFPAGDYKTIKFGIGVDAQRYLQGETAQQSFWDLAAANDLTWTWSTGYRFINFEGTYTSSHNTEALAYQVHQGSNTATDNYREVTLTLPTTARVRQTETPSIHFKVDANVLLDGDAKISLYDNINQAGTATAIMGGENLITIAGNSLKMFTVDHVHNGTGSHDE
ncbi:hypothetical protein DVK85_00905 [Flavobacterium arcticum]|uniref:Copper-binding protein MbnP-like domain-containing protein n=1 Tax=Flavobacterium arcticum TaxID=1784713 RepID=A0A345H8F5_9FLAO|nr:MbnP family protein [Flavobacterium arcticum]AXG72865.1 hypothetical protein DVK85_00905 [Flavobacterium arcticum]KAF2510471.1 hypothetical protein E0W72_08300 [Flavobacterium arcticum]